MSSSVRRSQTLPYALLSKIPMPSCPTGKAKKKGGEGPADYDRRSK